MAETGGAATVLGIWYQSLGAVATLVSGWRFDGQRNIVDGESLMSSSGERLQLFLEYFDMDAAMRGTHGIQLIQFKVSSQQRLRDFDLEEIREIFQNATQAILEHNKKQESDPSIVPIVGFLVASNRPIGKRFSALQDAVKNRDIDLTDPCSLSEFSKEPAPFLFKGGNVPETENEVEGEQGDGRGTAKTMLDFARSVTRLKASDWGFDSEHCITACLKAMATFTFAQAQAAKLEMELHQWLRTWGIKPEELDAYVTRILGKLLLPSSSKKGWDSLSIMSDVFASKSPVPLTSFEAWRSVIDQLRERLWPDPPTKELITRQGMPEWMLDRSSFLGNLPDFPEAPITTELPDDRPSLNTETPRIFALIGPGGVGKSSLLAHLFIKIGSSMWDWSANNFRSNTKFNGYPIILEAEERAVEAIEGSLKIWGKRKDAADDPVDRLAVANGVEGNNTAVWLGLDGVDEMDENSLIRFAKVLMNNVTRYPNLRIVLASRPRQFSYMQSVISGRRMLVQELNVPEFSQDEAYKALLQATDYKLVTGRDSEYASVGATRQVPEIIQGADPGGLLSSSQQPLFIGVIRDMYERERMAEIQAAYDGDTDGIKKVATHYVYVFCERLRKRLKCADIDERGIFNALKQLAELESPQLATKTYWDMVCKSHLGEITGHKLYRQCAASGLIREITSGGAFEWRHLSVGSFLLTMEENPQWE